MMEHPFSLGIDDLGNRPDKAKIDALGMIAEDASGDPAAVQVLSGILFRKLGTVEPPRKLPILYLIDHITKKLGRDFQAVFAGTLVQEFVAAYGQVSRRMCTRQTLVGSWSTPRGTGCVERTNALLDDLSA